MRFADIAEAGAGEGCRPQVDHHGEAITERAGRPA